MMVSHNSDRSLKSWLSDNSWNLLVTMILVGIGYGVVTTQFSYFKEQTIQNKADLAKHDEKLQGLDKSLDQTRMTQTSIVQRLERTELDARQTQKDVSEIRATLGILSTKLDSVIEILKSDRERGERRRDAAIPSN